MSEISTEHRKSTNTLNGGTQHKYEFPNGFGASVIQSPYSYGGDKGLWEVGVLGLNGRLTYETPITNDVLGHLTEDEVNETLAAIGALEAEARA